jgi:hypothetical protein
LNSPNSLLLDRYRFPSQGLPDFDSNAVFDAFEATSRGKGLSLPVNPGDMIDGLRYERYLESAGSGLPGPRARNLYYRLRPYLPDFLRRELQKAYLRGWNNTAFPSFPVDRTVDILLERLLVLNMRAWGKERLPFIWFWPKGYKACGIVTHDIETEAGRDFTSRLIDIDESFDIKSSIQIVPEKRYEVSEGFLSEIRSRGVEINVHGLDHEGNLFDNRQTFMECARRINEYADRFGAKGFRSPSMYRKADWFKELNFSYDMSYPNVAHLEPQAGGCCTLLPYALPAGMTELPLTTAQDYTLFHILGNYSIDLWKEQTDRILEGHGLLSFIVHPDYVRSARTQTVYLQLLEEVVKCREDRGVWVTLPGEVDRWWRERSQLEVVPHGDEWLIEGPGRERAAIAYACLDGDRLVYEFPDDALGTQGSSVLIQEGAC